MRMSAVVVGLVLSLALAVPTAHASDESLRSTAKKELTKLAKAEARYDKAIENLESDNASDAKKAKKETEKLISAVSSAHGKVEAEEADSSKLKKARTKLLDAMETYEEGLNTLVKALDNNSDSQAKSALKKIQSAAKKFKSAGRAFS
jgi:tetratricopeptide (TPR) repeat protein